MKDNGIMITVILGVQFLVLFALNKEQWFRDIAMVICFEFLHTPTS